MNPLYLLPGLAVAGTGFVVYFVLLVQQGAMPKHKQFAAIGNLASGRAGAGSRIAFFGAAGAMITGMLMVFGGVAASDGERASACQAVCEQRGYPRSAIRGSQMMEEGHAQRHAFVACVCEADGREPLELRADDLPR